MCNLCYHGSGGGRRGSAFRGGIGSGGNPFRGGGGGGGGYRVIPQGGNYGGGYGNSLHYDENYDEDFAGVMVGGPIRGGPGGIGLIEERFPSDMGIFGDGYGSMGRGHTYNYSSSTYQDSNGNVYEEDYGPNGPFRYNIRVSQPSGRAQGTVARIERRRPSRLEPRSTRPSSHRPARSEAPFQSPFWPNNINNPIHPNPRPNPSNPYRSTTHEHLLQPHPHPHSATTVRDPAAVPDRTETLESFIRHHTHPISSSSSAPPNTDCPICLEPASATHPCVQITGIEGCTHLIGTECLRQLLLSRPEGRKQCPLCRAQWVPEDGVWQDSEEWRRLGEWDGGARVPDGSRDQGGRRGYMRW
ncbi:hypothetical protein BDW02DRAFT_98656 [Decorospora gaudefroyi]|uniref:RING-type domain-containing protein n=1 Tax=Decorospora gaudefroyi TaxID=184978 RepID=A0A6A5K0S1_9PLEO|nr:hypothetical protein BDW02DRAFT_98656 [Decorospora gaudefroyi]